jgi:hypothetical protein
MTGSSPDDWILLARRLRSLLITLNYNAIAIPRTLQSTVAHALGFSVSTSRLLATGLNREISTSTHYQVFLLLRLQALCTNLYSATLHSSLTALNCTALAPIRFSTAHRLLISLHYSTHKVFTSHAKSSQADFFFNCELPAAPTANSSNPQLLSTPTGYYYNFLLLQPMTATANYYCQLQLLTTITHFVKVKVKVTLRLAV